MAWSPGPATSRASWCATVSSTRLLPAPAGSALTSEVVTPGPSSRQARAFGSAVGPSARVAWIEAMYPAETNGEENERHVTGAVRYGRRTEGDHARRAARGGGARIRPGAGPRGRPGGRGAGRGGGSVVCRRRLRTSRRDSRQPGRGGRRGRRARRGRHADP